MATIKEIAELAGVSRGTVDRVLNHRGSVNAETEKKVLEIAELLNYQPNKAGMALAAQKKKYTIGVLLFDAEHPFYDEVLIGLTAKLNELSIYGCTLLTKRTSYDPDAQLEAIDALCEEGIHGLILSPCDTPRLQHRIDSLWDIGIPCVTLNADLPSSKRIAYVGCDYYKSGKIAANLLQLLGFGIMKVGIVTGTHNRTSHEERVRGFSDYITNCRLPVQITDIRENADDDYHCYDVVSSMLSENPGINAVYLTASGVYGGCRAIQNSSLSKMPLVLAFDATPSTREMLETGIVTATICQNPQEQGACALSLLIDYLLTDKLPEQTLIHTNLDIKIKESL